MKSLARRVVKRAVIGAGLEVAALANRFGLRAAARGRGAIFTLHHVRPKRPRAFDPNAHLEITPDFLDRALATLAAEGYDFVPLSAIADRLAGDHPRPFAAFTLDDGYRNNAEHAAPVFARHGAPFTVFAAAGFVDRSQSIWWETAEALLARVDRLTLDFGNGPETVPTGSTIARIDAFDRIARAVATGPESAMVARLDAAARAAGLEPMQIVEDLVMTRDELAALSRQPLAEIGAHTITHPSLARLGPAAAREEMLRSAEMIAAVTGRRPLAFAYPYGSPADACAREFAIARDLGFTVAVTTRPGTLTAAHRDRLTGLPRISLNGYYQRPRYVRALASGLPFLADR